MNRSRSALLAKAITHLVADFAATRGDASQSAVRSERQCERAREVRRIFEELGPFYIKVGQILATRPDFVSAVMIRELETLNDSVTVAPFTLFEGVLREELGRGWPRSFREIDTERPLGSASLAQVYRVTTQGGRAAVIKVQRPGTREAALADMAKLGRGARLAGRLVPRLNAVVDVETLLEVIFDAMRPELDFTEEARSMNEGRAITDDFPRLSVPKVLLATPRVLLQSLAPGCSIREADPAGFRRKERLEIGEQLLTFMYHSYFIHRFFHADPHPGNIFVHPEHGATLIDWGMVGRIDRRVSSMIVMTMIGLAQNDGAGLAKAWVEMGHATAWADIGAFTDDMSRLVPRLTSCSLEELSFGVTLTTVLRRSAQRGIRTTPLIGLLGKSFGNMEGSIRCLAPELSLAEVYRDALQDVLINAAREVLSTEHTARLAMELILSGNAFPGQVRGLLHDISNRDLTVRTSMAAPQGADRAKEYVEALKPVGLVAAGVAAAMWLRRRRTPPNPSYPPIRSMPQGRSLR